MAALSMLSSDDRLNYAANQRRRTFGGRRDLMKVLGYTENPQYADFWSRYQRQDIAGKIIDLPVDQTWGGGEITIEEWPQWEELNRRLEVQSRMTEVDRLASIGDYAVLFIGVKDQTGALNESSTIDDVDIEKALLEPVKRISSLDDVLYLQQYPRDAVAISKTDSNPMSPRFGKPEVYDIAISTDTQTSAGSGSTITGNKAAKKTIIKVHHSRILHVTPNRILSDVQGFSRLLRILDRLEDLDKVVGGSAEMFWLGADRPLVLRQESTGASAGATNVGSAGAKEDLRQQAEEFAHGLRRLLMVKNGTVETLTPNSPDPSGIAGILLQLIAAGANIPLRLLIGSERGELASSQDRSNFADTISNRRTNYAQPQILKAFIRRLHEWGQAPDPAALTLKWPPIEVLSASEKSEIDERMVSSMAEAEKALVLSGGVAFAPDDFRRVLGFEGAAPSAAITGVRDISVDESDPDVQAQFDRRNKPKPVS